MKRTILLQLAVLFIFNGCTKAPDLVSPAPATSGSALEKKGGKNPPTPPLGLQPSGNIVAADLDGSLHVWRFDGSSLIKTWTNTGAGSYWGVAVGDVDPAPGLELVAINRITPKPRKIPRTLDLEIYTNGAGTPSARYSLLPQAYTSARSLKIGDPDGDLIEEILVGGRSSLQVWEYDGTSGLYKSWEDVFSDPTSDFPTSVEMGDANNDGDSEILYSSLTYKTFVVYDENGGNDWGPRQPAQPFTEGMVRIKVGDVDNDGFNEVVCCGSGKSLGIYEYSNQAFNLAYTLQLPGYPHGLAIGDFDNDGSQEIAVGTNTPGALMIFRCSVEDFEYSFSEELSQQIANVVYIASGDCDGDTVPEFIVGTSESLMLYKFVNGSYNYYSSFVGSEMIQIYVR